jgi:DNA modification methylase
MSLPKPYYENELGRLYHGDCLEILPHLEPVDLVLTDPPYGVSGEQNTKSAKNRNYKKNSYLGRCDSIELVMEVAVPCINECLKMTKRLILTPGNKCLTLYPMPNSFGSINQPASIGLQPWGRADSQPIFYYGKYPYDSKKIPGQKCSYLSTHKAEENGHPCPKPIGLWLQLLLHGSLINETVLDPFLGSGTTAVACERLKRRWIGIEIEEKYCAIAVKRIEGERRQLKLF